MTDLSGYTKKSTANGEPGEFVDEPATDADILDDAGNLAMSATSSATPSPPTCCAPASTQSSSPNCSATPASTPPAGTPCPPTPTSKTPSEASPPINGAPLTWANSNGCTGLHGPYRHPHTHEPGPRLRGDQRVLRVVTRLAIPSVLVVRPGVSSSASRSGCGPSGQAARCRVWRGSSAPAIGWAS